jgi:hypothetical protein
VTPHNESCEGVGVDEEVDDEDAAAGVASVVTSKIGLFPYGHAFGSSS